MKNATLSQPLLRSLFAFGIVGVTATLVHVIVGLSIVSAGLLAPFSANFIAFMTAFIVSYFGHRRFTFQSNAPTSRALPRFLVVAAIGLVLNQIIVYVAVDLLGWDYIIALAIVVTTVPVLVYFVGKFWAFREDPA